MTIGTIQAFSGNESLPQIALPQDTSAEHCCNTGRKKTCCLMPLRVVADLEILAMQSHLPCTDSTSEVTGIYQYIGPAGI